MFDSTNARWGLFIACHPIRHILISLLFVLALSIHLINLRIEYDIRASFSPKNSKAMREERIYQQFYNMSNSPLRSFVLFSAKDGGSMLRPAHLREVLSLDAEVNGQVLRRDSTTGMRVCDPLCSLNGPFHLVAKALLPSNRSLQLAANLSSSSSAPLLLDYPIASFHGSDLFLGGHILGVQTANHTFANNNSRIVSAQKIILWYFNRADTVETKKRMRELNLKLFDEAQIGDRLNGVKFEVFGDDIANSEMIRGAIQATILMSIGFILLLLFVTFVIFRLLSASPVPLLSVLCVVSVAILCPLLSSLAAFGLCTWMGNPLYTIMCVTPFLIAGVGVDDAFIMLQSWQHHRAIGCPRQRLSLVMVHVGPSITITSLTNTIAFGIGFFTPTPQMSLFCLCTSIAVFIDYLLTFTLLCPVVVLLSSHQCSAVVVADDQQQKHPPLLLTAAASPPAVPSSACDAEATGKMPPSTAALPCRPVVFMPSSPRSSPLHPTPPPWVHRYARFLHSARGRLAALCVAALMYAVGTSGVLRLNSSFEPSKAFPSDSPLASSISSLREVFEEFFPIQVIVNRPPNISDHAQYAEFNAMVAQLEALPESWGDRRTLLWLRQYEQFDRRTDKFWRSLGFAKHRQYSPGYENLAFFLDQLGNPPAIKTEAVAQRVGDAKDKQLRVTAFQFTIVVRHMTEWWNRAVVEEKVRAILDRFPQFNATLHDGDAAILNMLLTVKSDLIGSIAVTIVCMAVVCSLFIYSRLGVGAIALCITSICFTLVGVLSWCGADLDPVTMVDVLLATGFSVDYTAHVAHQYHTKKGTSTDRIAHSLHEMCPPMLQAGISTALCMLPLAFVPTYAIVAFAKTIFAVISIGLVHGLFLLPVLLCALPAEKRNQRKSKEMEERRRERGGGGAKQEEEERLGEEERE
ncbi:hypothetical protein niasHT_001440 [Heterodera trifolii]|uniref:SSD domain-containing protein n=1 Tax=Heterodera trifolii TaxID=157864 RepID=A0ABD2LU92_9BILA